MVELGARPAIGGMAVITAIIALDVTCTLAARRPAVVAAHAGADRCRVVNPRHRFPAARDMAVLADVGRLNMGRRLTGRLSAVMTAGTIARHRSVIEPTATPAVGGVAILAAIIACDVVG